ncbi:MAG: TIGR01212 family radical SAM protein [Spirochaetota bacterium]
MSTVTSPYYRTFSSYLRQRFGRKVFRISMDAGFSCPNRDGSIGREGCAYCQARGSWNGRDAPIPLEQQVKEGKIKASRRYGAEKFIAYFQAYTNTYAPPQVLKNIYDSVIREDDDIVGMAVGTRPDCIDEHKLQVIASYARDDFDVWIEYGLQSSNDRTLELIGRGHNAASFKQAVLGTKRYPIKVAAHIIIGLPGEGRKEIIDTARFLASLPVDGLKLHNLNILKGTRMEEWYIRNELKPLQMDQYAELVVDFLERIPPSVVVHRLAAEAGSTCLAAPRWSMNKNKVVQEIVNRFKQRKTYQGKLYGKL